ncbi:hypothetical protein DSL64_03000 [Dyadobacter luteus]|uniref:Uncharacterized protein n=1 Tax=Dyadobacter luteus TaxID=2259619 RepID=A0A3D8YFJ6_9BACT|nr:hypothetical protein [Dyadobacter luteus]REA63431.1 hypothetical protein DSL64_03000 [Dyadobacter luteus]
MNATKFFENSRFDIRAEGWGEVELQDVIKLLDNVISTFYGYLDESSLPVRNVNIINAKESGDVEGPEIRRRGDFDQVYLDVSGRYWSQYVYQFSHELCHHVIDIDYSPEDDHYGWLEESICEMASLFIMLKMESSWSGGEAPYQNWEGYAAVLGNYARTIAEQSIVLYEPFHLWLTRNTSYLSAGRYDRRKNRIIALQMMPLFIQTPELWKAVQFFKFADAGSHRTISEFLEDWKSFLPYSLQVPFGGFISLFTTGQK